MASITPYHTQVWHADFNSERELPLIRFCQRSIRPDEPVAVIGWNAYIVIKKQADKLDEMDAELQRLHEQIARLGLSETFAADLEAQRPFKLPEDSDAGS